MSKIKNNHYKFNSYVDLNRFISYYYQIKFVLDLNPKTILEIGVGNKFFYNYFKSNNFDMLNCDLDESLNPDVISDVRCLDLKANSFDVVCCFQVLEHIPLSDFEIAINELRRVSKKYVVLSLPYNSYNFQFLFHFPFSKTLFNCNYFEFSLRFPLYLKHKFKGEHYWEIGKRGCSIYKIRKLIKKNKLKIVKEYSPFLNKYHLFFILEKIK